MGGLFMSMDVLLWKFGTATDASQTAVVLKL